jgi:hypothetical protein
MIRQLNLFVLYFGICLLLLTPLFSQEVYQLSAGGGLPPSLALRQATGLLIRDSSGNETIYRRENRFDDGSDWLGYYSKEARQALQWPRTNQGPMRIGTMQGDQQWRFHFSRMSIQPSANNPFPHSSIPSTLPNIVNAGMENLVLPNSDFSNANQLVPLNLNLNQAPIPVHFGMGEANRRRYLSRGPSGGLTLVPQSSMGSHNWNIVPLANGLARIQYIDNGTVLALGCQNNSSPLDLYALADRADQLWRINPYPSAKGCYALESLQYPGQALTFQQNQFLLAPIAYSPTQQWWPTAPVMPSIQPLYRSVQQQTIPNPPLPAASVQFTNRHSEALVVLLNDLRPGGVAKKLRIPARGNEFLQLDRDNGATLVEVFEVRSQYGNWDRREFRTPIPPTTLYDVSVYEEFLQSIAIDRTGTSPNPIEDINYQPRSVGIFTIPPGNSLPQQASLDVHGLATAARNSGAVRRLNPQDYNHKSPPSDPLQEILREFQGRRAAF